MRVLIAPDKFAGTLSAVQAAEAIAQGWRRHAPDDELDLAPMSDGGPGFVDVLHSALGGDLAALTVTGPTGAPTPAAVLLADGTAYVEAAQACGHHLMKEADPLRGTSYGVGELIRAAHESGCGRIVVGLGGAATSDGGAGALAALGAEPAELLRAGVAGLSGLAGADPEVGSQIRLPAALTGVELVAATDVDIPLTGLFGTAKAFGPEQGLSDEQLPLVDGWLEGFAASTDRRRSLEPGAGAAGGLGFALLLLGGHREPGIALVSAAVRLAERARAADLVITGEGAFDFSSRSGKVPYGVAEVAANAVRPCVAIAGQVLVGSREMRALGVESAYALADVVGIERAFAEPAAALAEVAMRVARTWSPRS